MLTAQIIVQVVSWPLVGLLSWTVLRRPGTATAVRPTPVTPVIATVTVVGATAVLALDATADTTVSRVCATLIGWGTALLLAVYPTGGPVPRWTIGVVAAVYAVQTANLATGFGLETQPWWPWHYFAWVLPLLFAQFLRYRSRSDARQRQQVRWVLATYLSMMAAFMVMLFAETGGLIASDHTSPIAVVLLMLPGVGFSFGLLAPGSTNVDRALRWIVTVGGWLFIVSGTIAATIGWTGEQERWAAAALIALAALVGWTIMTWVGARVVYGARPDALRVLDDLDELLAAHHDAAAVPESVVSTLAAAIGTDHVTLYDAKGRELARLGNPTRPVGSGATFPVTYRGVELAQLWVHPRRGEQTLTADDRAVIQRVCAYAGPALDGARAMAEIIASRSKIVIAREEERKRMRAILHDDLAPSFSGLSLTASALTRYAGNADPRAAEVAARLAEDFTVATRQLRDLAYDLRPPALDDRGLVPALRDRLLTPGERPAVVIEVDAASRSPLPAAVEAAAFRIVSEAVTNVRRHAAATACTIELSCDDGALRFRVTDDGIGLAPGATHGVGLTSMRERATELGGALRIGRNGQQGTLVEGWLPLHSGLHEGVSHEPIGGGR